MRETLLINGVALVFAWVVLPVTAATPERNPADFGPMFVTFTTWVRAAPNEQARVIDEIDTGRQVQVEMCGGGWCRVREERGEGYLQQRYLAASLIPMQPGAGACFPGQYYTADGPLGLTICPAKSPVR